MFGGKGTSKRLYSIREAAIYLGWSPWAVRRLIWSGMLPEVRTGRRVHVDIQDMEKLIQANKSSQEMD